MPLYEFVCKGCGNKEEHLLKISDENPVCQNCQIKLEKIVSLSTFVLKGDGWYKDGYSSKKDIK